MKQMHLRKVAAAALVGTMALSCASCMLFGPNKKEIVEAADEFAGVLLKQDAGKIAKLTNEKKNSKTVEEFEYLFDDTWFNDDQKKFIDAVSDTITYEIDEDSVEADKEEASVDVTFTMVDYEKALKGEDFSDIDEVLDALEDCDETNEVKVTFEFEKDDDEWLISNLKDKDYKKVFDFYSYELNLKPNLVSVLDYSECYGGSYYIDTYVYFTEDVSEYDGEITFDVYYEGQQIAADEEAYVYYYYAWCEYYDPDYDYLASGEYTVVVKYGDMEITSATTDVDNSYYETTAATFSGNTADLINEIDYTEWYYDSDTDGVYNAGTYSIEFDVYFNVDISGVDFTFDVTNEDGDIIDSYKTPTSGSYYVWCYYTNSDYSELEPGEYTIWLYDGSGSDANLIAKDTCEVK